MFSCLHSGLPSQDSICPSMAGKYIPARSQFDAILNGSGLYAKSLALLAYTKRISFFSSFNDNFGKNHNTGPLPEYSVSTLLIIDIIVSVVIRSWYKSFE